MQKRILIVDDSEFKANKIKDALKNIYKDTRFCIERTYHEAMRFIVDNQDYIDLMVLDWSFPTFSGMAPDPDAGARLLSEMYERDIEFDVIVCSSGYVDEKNEDIIGSILYNEKTNLRERFISIIGQENIDRDNELDRDERSLLKK